MQHAKAAKTTDYELDIAKTGLRLFDVVPCVFPDHVLIQSLKTENELLRKAMLTRFWRDNGPWTLWRALDLANRRDMACRCSRCFEAPAAPVSCLMWDRFRWAMASAGISHALVRVDDAELNESAVQGQVKINFEPFGANMALTYPKPAGFNALTACEFMAPVSHVDLHLVIKTRGRTVGLTYGRKLWECTDVVRDGKELRKLDMLLAFLYRGESKLEMTGVRDDVPALG